MTKSAYFVETRDQASEIKFLVDSHTAAGIRSWARSMLQADPHGSGSHGDEYLITSLYFDTDDFAVFRQIGSYGRSKYRIRRYGSSNAVFLERKMRTRRVLSKRRTPVVCEDLAMLAGARQPGKNGNHEWAGTWFRERLRVRRFAPMIQVSYHRTARIAETELGTIRLTVDDDLRALPAAGLSFLPGSGDVVNHSHSIVEFKFRMAMPLVFKQLVEHFAIEPQRVSKYRMAATALGLVPPLQEGSATKADERDVTLCLPMI
jgi:hypothetical protein